MEESEKNEREREKNRSPSPAIKSSAVVKYTAVQSPAGYAQLQCNTDLNLPPSNWSSDVGSYGLKHIFTSGSGFSSFRMAHMFPDTVGSVDVISGAECIKKLLKLPYQPDGTVSIMVHRVENTLLLDDFDIYDYLMKSEWKWLKDFFYENILKTMSEQEQMVFIQKKTSPALQLTSKFLCHSVASLPQPDKVKVDLQPSSTPMLEGPHLPEPESISEAPNEHLYNRNVLWTFENIQMLIGSDLPIFGGKDRPCVSLRLADSREPINVLTGIDYWLDNLMCNVPEVLMCYHIDGIVQKYEPMKTEDIPNLDGSKFSPKAIKNVAQNILSFLKSNATKSGHTYWLFKGPDDEVVKLYDLTSLRGGLDESEASNNPFTTPVAMLLYRVARNMRMTNRTKHVKRLLEDAIKLLSEQCHPQIVASSHYMLADLYVPATTNPARPDFKAQENDEGSGEAQSPSPKKQDQSPSSKDKKREEEKGSKSNEGEGSSESSELVLQTRGLALHDIGKLVPPAYQESKSNLDESNSVLSTEPPMRCGQALLHSLKGLQALHHVTLTKCEEEERKRLKQQIILEEQNPKMANPLQPIKLNYKPLSKTKSQKQTKEQNLRGRRRKRERKTIDNKNNPENFSLDKSSTDKNAILIRKENNVFPSWYEPRRDDNFAWKLHLKTLLYEKICLAYATLAEYSYAKQQYGFSLKHIEMASKCQKLLGKMIIRSRVVDASCLIGRVGDNYYQFSQNWTSFAQYKKQFEADHETDRLLKVELRDDLIEEMGDVEKCDEFDLNIQLPKDERDAMVLSCKYYKNAINVSDVEKRSELLRRFAHVNNELGVKYMNDAQILYSNYMSQVVEEEKETTDRQSMLKECSELSFKSLKCLNEAIEIFENVKDIANLALLYCNKGRYLRFRAHCDINNKGFGSEARSLYKQAEELYKDALRVLDNREQCGAAKIWDLVTWELSSHTYMKATLMQDNPLNYNNEAKDVEEAFKNALKFCNLSPGSKQSVYQFRAAMIHYKMAALYHRQFRDTPEQAAGRRRRTWEAAKGGYAAAAAALAELGDAALYLTVAGHHVALLEDAAAAWPNLKLKSLQNAVQLIRQCHSIVTLIKDRDPDEAIEPVKYAEHREVENEMALLCLLRDRLQGILKDVMVYCRSKSNKDYVKLYNMYKRMYATSLQIINSTDLTVFASSLCETFDSMNAIDVEFE